VADEKTLEALIANRYEVMAGFARQLKLALKQEVASLPQLPTQTALAAAKRWMHRDELQVPEKFRAHLAQARAALPHVDTMVSMREELRQMWLNTHANRSQLAAELQAWCKRAETSGVAALRDFSMQLRTARMG
jgi:stearoyl-CoA desaturase (delta-9 desaturase)